MSDRNIDSGNGDLGQLRQAIARAGLSEAGAHEPDSELRERIEQALQEEEDGSTAAAADDPAKAALSVLQSDPELGELLSGEVPGDRPRDFSPLNEVLTSTSAALIVLSTYVEFERDKDGRWKFRFIIKPQTEKMKNAILGLARSVAEIIPHK